MASSSILPRAISASRYLSSTVVRVAFAKSPDFFTRASIDVIPHDSMTAGWKLAERPTSIVLSTAKLQVIVNRSSGAVSFPDAAGRPILSEAAGSAPSSRPTSKAKTHPTFSTMEGPARRVPLRARPDAARHYRHQGLRPRPLAAQHQHRCAVPRLLHGYGILWDNTSFTRFGDLRPFAAIPAANLFDADGKPGGLTVAPDRRLPAAEPDRRHHIDCAAIVRADGAPPAPLKAQRWQGSILAPVTGDYQFKAYSNGGIQVWLDGKLVMNHWRQNWTHQRSGPRPSPRRSQVPHQDRERPRAAVHPHLPLEDPAAHWTPPSGRRSAMASTTPCLRSLARSGHRRLSLPHRQGHHVAQLGLRPMAVAPAL